MSDDSESGGGVVAFAAFYLILAWFIALWPFRFTYFAEVAYFVGDSTEYDLGSTEHFDKDECLSEAASTAASLAGNSPSRIQEYWCRKIDYRGNFVDRVQ